MTTPQLSNLSLGPLDADRDENLKDYFITIEDFKNLIEKRLFIIVGPKGTGKSAIKRYLCDLRQNQQKLVIEINSKHGFPLDQLNTSSPAEIKNKMKGYFTALVLNHLSESPQILPKKKTKLKNLGDGTPIIQKFLKPLKITTPIGEYAISELFSSNKRVELLTVLDNKVVDEIKTALDENDLWLMLDDIDTIFTSDDANASLKFIEGLVYSASDINARAFGKSVWIVLFLRAEIYEELKRKAIELDKVLSYIWQIAWDEDALMEFLGERIRWAFHSKKGLPNWEYFKLLYEVNNKSEALNIFKYLVERSINGPRDLLLLVDMARKVAATRGAARISLSDIKESEYDYGKTKLEQINSNFQRVYNDIDHVIDRLLRERKQIYQRKALLKHIDNELLTHPQAREDFRDLRWLRTCTSFRLMEILYQTGLIGYWDAAKKRYVYALEKTKLDQTVTGETKFRVHSAFSTYLELTPLRTR
jgi:hypothetical protein